jgi:dTDP-4-dehydrorhamnose 3,5-epimerase-like enzyme
MMPQETSPEAVVFHDGPIDGVTFKPLSPYKDHRGWLIELYRADQLPPSNVP